MTEEETIKVRNQEAEIAVRDGDMEIKYGRDEDGELRIVEASGFKPEQDEEDTLMDKLLNANPNNCPKCLEAELRNDLTCLLFMSLLEEEDILDGLCFF